MRLKQSKLGIRISEQPLSFDGKILSVPFYFVPFLKKLAFTKYSST